jgi:ABC-type bacteriocin/lantibiotic exporter with double-glycine peptidase domain
LVSSLKESKFKYKVASWLQELARNSNSFKRENYHEFALIKNDKLVQDYLNYREKHFNIIRKQFIQLISFKVIITASLLLIGGFLVLNEQMNIGQFVAAEIIILLVINSVEKIILGLETFYDVLTSIEKIGQITDMEIEQETYVNQTECYNSISLEADNICFHFPDSNENVLENINLTIEQGEKICIDGDNGSGKTTLIRLLAGIIQPTYGALYINDDTFRKINLAQYRAHIAYLTQGETLFEGTIAQNLMFGYSANNDEIKSALDAVQLTSFIKTLPEGLDTKIHPEGKQLSSSNAQKILLARCIISKPRILFLENPTDKMDEETSTKIIDYLTDSKRHWTLVVASKNPKWRKQGSRIILIENGKISSDSKI